MKKLHIKICGVREPKIAYFAACCGADLIGVNFCASARHRKIDLEQAREIIMAARDGGAKCVGIFREQNYQTILSIATQAQLDFVQLHGGRSLDESELLPRSISRILVQIEGINRINSAAINMRAEEFILCDAKNPGQGKLFDRQTFIPPTKPWILAGGLTPINVGALIKQLQPHGVDVASGVEDDNKVQDPARIEAFIINARYAGETKCS